MTRSCVLAALVSCLVISACGPETRQPSPTEAPAVTTTVPATTTTTLSIEDATTVFRACLVEGGVRIPPIPFDSQGRPRLELAMVGVDFSDPASVTALAACSDHLVEGALDLSVWPALQESVLDLLSEFSECVRSHGVLTFPDPVRSFTGVGGPFPLEEIPFDDPGLEEAVDVCGSRLVESG